MSEHSPARAGDLPAGHPKTDAPEPDRLIGITELCRITSLSRTTIWRLERAGNFPRRRKIAPNRVGWIFREAQTWIREREAIQ